MMSSVLGCILRQRVTRAHWCFLWWSSSAREAAGRSRRPLAPYLVLAVGDGHVQRVCLAAGAARTRHATPPTKSTQKNRTQKRTVQVCPRYTNIGSSRPLGRRPLGRPLGPCGSWLWLPAAPTEEATPPQRSSLRPPPYPPTPTPSTISALSPCESSSMCNRAARFQKITDIPKLLSRQRSPILVEYVHPPPPTRPRLLQCAFSLSSRRCSASQQMPSTLRSLAPSRRPAPTCTSVPLAPFSRSRRHPTSRVCHTTRSRPTMARRRCAASRARSSSAAPSRSRRATRGMVTPS